MATLIIMNYATGLVYAKELEPNSHFQDEDYEEYIVEGLRMKLRDVYYMVTNEEYPIEYI